jgi:hypothetical protein
MNKHEADFTREVRRALYEGLDNIPTHYLERLASARQLAVSRKKQPAFSRLFATLPKLSMAGNSASGPEWASSRLWLMVSLASLLIGLTMIYDMSLHQHIHETAEIDAMVLTDELPLTAYLDEGFNGYLDQKDED